MTALHVSGGTWTSSSSKPGCMLDNRSNAYVEAMNGLLQQATRAARGFTTASHFIAIAYLRMSKLNHLPANPLLPALPQAGVLIHQCL